MGSPASRQSRDGVAGAVGAGAPGCGGADGRAAERLGVLEACCDSRPRLELRVRADCRRGAGVEQGRAAGIAAQALDCRVRIAVCAARGVCFSGVSQEEAAEMAISG